MAVETLSLAEHPAATGGRLAALVPAGRVARGALRGAMIWGTVAGVAAWLEVVQFAREYPTAADRARLLRMMGSNAGLDAIFGPSPKIDTAPGYAASHMLGVFGIIGAVWGLLAATRLLRGEEEAGRWELLLAGRTTRRRASAAAVAGLGIALLTFWAVTAGFYAAIGRSSDARFSLGSSLFAALATAAGAAIFLAVGALCSQVAATRRQAAGLAAAVFGVSYALRVVAYSGTSARWLRWATPLGWIDELRPLTGNRPLPVLFLVGALIVLVAATIALAGRRDLGSGILRARETAPARTRSLTGPFGLAARLDRGAVLGWGGGLAAGALVVGLITKGTEQLWANQTGGLFVRLTGATGGAVYLGIVFLLFASLIALAAAGQAAATREEEAEGYLDHLLARPVGRLSWLTARFVVSAGVLCAVGLLVGTFAWVGAAAGGSSIGLLRMLAAGVNLVPAGILVLGVGTLVHGVAPRVAATVAYGLVAWSFLLEVVGTSLRLNHALLDLSVFHFVARAPAADVRWGGAAALAAVGLTAAAAGAWRFARRDLAGA